MGSPSRASSASGTSASSGSCFSVACTSSGRPIACTRISAGTPTESRTVADVGVLAGGKTPSVTTTALVAPSAESASFSTNVAASEGVSASVREPLSAARARRRLLELRESSPPAATAGSRYSVCVAASCEMTTGMSSEAGRSLLERRGVARSAIHAADSPVGAFPLCAGVISKLFNARCGTKSNRRAHT